MADFERKKHMHYQRLKSKRNTFDIELKQIFKNKFRIIIIMTGILLNKGDVLFNDR